MHQFNVNIQTATNPIRIIYSIINPEDANHPFSSRKILKEHSTVRTYKRGIKNHSSCAKSTTLCPKVSWDNRYCYNQFDESYYSSKCCSGVSRREQRKIDSIIVDCPEDLNQLFCRPTPNESFKSSLTIIYSRTTVILISFCIDSPSEAWVQSLSSIQPTIVMKPKQFYINLPCQIKSQVMHQVKHQVNNQSPNEVPTQVSSLVLIEYPNQDPNLNFSLQGFRRAFNTEIWRDESNIFLPALLTSLIHMCPQMSFVYWSYHRNPYFSSSAWCTTKVYPRSLYHLDYC